MEFRRVHLDDPAVAPLMTGIMQEYDVRYGPGNEADDVPVEYAPPDGSFLVLLDGDTTVAGGGLRRFDPVTGEIKRLWTNPAYRRQGHAIAVLAELGEIARELGYERMRLETGPAQPEALALYRRLGYREIGNYGHYERAVGFERLLTGGAATENDG